MGRLANGVWLWTPSARSHQSSWVWKKATQWASAPTLNLKWHRQIHVWVKTLIFLTVDPFFFFIMSLFNGFPRLLAEGEATELQIGHLQGKQIYSYSPWLLQLYTSGLKHTQQRAVKTTHTFFSASPPIFLVLFVWIFSCLSHPHFLIPIKKSLCAEQHSVVLATVERAMIYHRNSQIRPGMSAYGAQSWRTEQTTGTQSHTQSWKWHQKAKSEPQLICQVQRTQRKLGWWCRCVESDWLIHVHTHTHY